MSSRIKNDSVQCVFVDEAQFLKKEQVRQLCRIVDELDIPILAYGIRSDFKGEPFGMYIIYNHNFNILYMNFNDIY